MNSSPIAASVRNLTLYDEGHAHIAAEVRDKEFRPAADVRVSARIIGPGGVSATMDLDPAPNQPGQFQTDWVAPNTGVYVVELTAHRGSEDLGSDVATFERLDGVAESFHTEQNRSLLETLANGTGGRYVRPADLQALAREIPYSSAGVTSQQLKDLWNMPAVFLLLLCLRCGEWLLRRRWGIV